MRRGDDGDIAIRPQRLHEPINQSRIDQRLVALHIDNDRKFLRAFCHLGGKHPAQAVAEITLVDGAAGKLMRNLQRGGGVRGADPETEDGGRGDRGSKDMAACQHECLP